MIEAIIAIVGVILGAVLTAWLTVFESQRQRKQKMRALLDELKTNVHMLPQKRDIVRRMIEELQNDRILPGGTVRFCRTMYDQTYASISPHMTARERNSFHLVYEYCRAIDEILTNYSDDIIAFKDDVDQVERLVPVALAKLNDILGLMNDVERIAIPHLDGGPVDVFYLGENYEEVARRRYR